jgi:hypothetical protein
VRVTFIINNVWHALLELRPNESQIFHSRPGERHLVTFPRGAFTKSAYVGAEDEEKCAKALLRHRLKVSCVWLRTHCA